MKNILILSLALIGLASCGTDDPAPYEKQGKEVGHIGENTFHFDSTFVQASDTVRYALDLKPLPGFFVMGQVETDSFFEAHLYEDTYLVFRRNEDSFYVCKDSLTAFVNEEYLNEAMIEDVHLMIFEPGAQMFLFEFAVRKPLEDDRFHFQVFMDKGQHQINIVDE